MDDLTLQMFFEEAAETVQDLEEGLLRLERAPGDPETLNRILRGAHTLKGTAAMLGFEAIVRFSHLLEDALTRLPGRSPATPPAVADLLLASADVLRTLLQRAKDKDSREVERLEDVSRSLRALTRGDDAAVPGPRPAPSRERAGNPAVYEIRFSPPADLLQRGLDAIRLLASLGELGEVVRVSLATGPLPPLEEMDPERAYLGFTCWLRTREPRERLESCFEFVGDPAAVRIETVPGVPEADEAIAPTSEAVTIRVATEKVDRLVNLVGELAIKQSMVAQLMAGFTPDRLGELQRAVEQMGRDVRTLEERVMAVRMLPIRTAFGRLRRMIRDLAQTLGKQVVLRTSGEETELDKGVIEQISDPLVHLVRNALDHGIEPPELRRQAGKPEAARLELRAYQHGGNIYIEVADDGRGLDGERILARAVASGLVSRDESPSDDELFGLIFEPGFSTAETTTEVSGRGIGMDVVKRNVEVLGGSIAIETGRGRGTTFRVKLPLTLAILDGQTLRVGGERYLLPLVSIIESVRPRREQLRHLPGNRETITVRSQVLPMLRLARLFAVAAATDDPTQGLVVIVEDEGRQLGLLVDELLDQQQVVVKSLEANFQKLQGIAGATVLGDGRVALILDVSGLVAATRAAGRDLDAECRRPVGSFAETAR